MELATQKELLSTERRKLKYKKQEWENNFYLWCKDLLWYRRLQPQPHQSMTKRAQDFIMNPAIRTHLELDPRISFKSTIWAQALPLWIEKKFPGTRTLLTSSTHRNAVKRLGAIKNICEGTTPGGRRFVKAYGDWRAMPGWTNDYVDFVGLKERPDGAVHEHSIDTAGIDRTQVGDHYDLIIVDDIHDENNSQTAEQIERVTDYLQTLAPYLDRKSTMPGGQGKIIYIGTRWNFGDAYEWLMNNEPSLSFSSNSCYDGPDGLFFPEELTHEFLASERARLKTRLFSSWYLNEPQAEGDKVFKEEWKQTLDASYVKTKQGLGKIYFSDGSEIPVIPRLTLDPALGLSKTSDYVGICLMGWAMEGARYIIKTWRFRESPKQIIDRLVNMVRQYGVATLGVEGVAFQRIYGDLIRTHFIESDIPIPVIHIKTDTWKSKKKRVESLLEKPFEEGKIYILPGNELFIADYDHWPQLKYDDVIDSVAMQFEQSVMEPNISYMNRRKNRWFVHPEDREPQERVFGSINEVMSRKSYVGKYSG